MAVFPVFVEMDQRDCLIIGGGQVALRKIRILLDAGAKVTVIGPSFCPELEQLASEGRIVCLPCETEYTLDFLKARLEQGMVPAFGICAASDKQMNHEAAVFLKHSDVLVDSATETGDCDFFFPSVIRRDPVMVGISTGGQAPSVSRHLRRILEAALPEWTGQWAERMKDIRRWVLDHVRESRRKKLIQHMTSEIWNEYAQQGKETKAWSERVCELERMAESGEEDEI